MSWIRDGFWHRYASNYHSVHKSFLERLVEPHYRILDIGCGTGILAISSLLLGAQHAVAVDIDPDAVRIARENAMQNGVCPV